MSKSDDGEESRHPMERALNPETGEFQRQDRPNEGQLMNSSSDSGDQDIAVPTQQPSECSPYEGENESAPFRERLRRRLGVSPRQWMMGVSVGIFLPYVLFTYLLFATSVGGTRFMAITVFYSLIAIVANFVL